MIESKWLSLYVATGVIVLLILYIYHLIVDGKQKFTVYEIIAMILLTPFWPVYIIIPAIIWFDKYAETCENQNKKSWWIKILTKQFKL